MSSRNLLAAVAAVARRNALGGCLLAACLWGVVLNLVPVSGYYDTALWSFALVMPAIMIAVLAMVRLGHRTRNLDSIAAYAVVEQRYPIPQERAYMDAAHKASLLRNG